MDVIIIFAHHPEQCIVKFFSGAFLGTNVRTGRAKALIVDTGLNTAHCMRSLKPVRTIADLVRCEEIQSVHLAGALQYRPKLMLNE